MFVVHNYGLVKRDRDALFAEVCRNVAISDAQDAVEHTTLLAGDMVFPLEGAEDTIVFAERQLQMQPPRGRAPPLGRPRPPT